MKEVYLLTHSYDYGVEAEHSEVKIIGIYSTFELAKKTVEYYKTLPGFREFEDECFCINNYKLNSSEWAEGFVYLDE